MRSLASLFAFAAALAVVTATPDADARRVSGAAISDDTVKVDSHRFLSKLTWDKTLRFYRSVYRRSANVVWHTVTTPPGTRAVHLQNTKASDKWEGINIYEHRGKVHVFVIAREAR